jgi:hypothetical protein
MSSKTTLLLLTASVLLASMFAVNLPHVNALIQRDFSILDDSHTTASYGYSKVCGNHLCAVGEHMQWINAIWHSQKASYGKVTNAPHGEDVMHNMAGSTASPMSSHGTMKMSGNMTMTGNMTK